MSKCGKGCLPECEYFTTGGCISPFNCMYKEESGYINSATSGTVIYTGGMNMPDEEMIENLKCVIADIFEQCEQLKAENAELKARLEKAVELPFGDRVWFITEDEEGAESYIISKPTDLLTVDELYEIGKKYFTTREAAEKRAELNGGKQ